MEVEDWRCVSQHYVLELIEKAVTVHGGLASRFIPTIIVAASEDALSVCKTLRSVLKEHHRDKGEGREEESPFPSPVILLASTLQRYDEEVNPYNPLLDGTWSGSFSGARVLVVDKVRCDEVLLVIVKRYTRVRGVWVARGHAYVTCLSPAPSISTVSRPPYPHTSGSRNPAPQLSA